MGGILWIEVSPRGSNSGGEVDGSHGGRGSLVDVASIVVGSKQTRALVLPVDDDGQMCAWNEGGLVGEEGGEAELYQWRVVLVNRGCFRAAMKKVNFISSISLILSARFMLIIVRLPP